MTGDRISDAPWIFSFRELVSSVLVGGGALHGLGLSYIVLQTGKVSEIQSMYSNDVEINIIDTSDARSYDRVWMVVHCGPETPKTPKLQGS